MARLEIMFRMVTAANQNDREQYYRRSQVLSHLRHHPHSRHSAPGLCEAGQEWPQQEVFFVTEQDNRTSCVECVVGRVVPGCFVVCLVCVRVYVCM